MDGFLARSLLSNELVIPPSFPLIFSDLDEPWVKIHLSTFGLICGRITKLWIRHVLDLIIVWPPGHESIDYGSIWKRRRPNFPDSPNPPTFNVSEKAPDSIRKFNL